MEVQGGVVKELETQGQFRYRYKPAPKTCIHQLCQRNPMGVSQQLNPLLFFLHDLFQPVLFLSALIDNFLPILNLLFHLFCDLFGKNQWLVNTALLLVLWNVAVCTFKQLNNWIVHLFFLSL